MRQIQVETRPQSQPVPTKDSQERALLLLHVGHLYCLMCSALAGVIFTHFPWNHLSHTSQQIQNSSDAQFSPQAPHKVSPCSSSSSSSNPSSSSFPCSFEYLIWDSEPRCSHFKRNTVKICYLDTATNIRYGCESECRILLNCRVLHQIYRARVLWQMRRIQVTQVKMQGGGTKMISSDYFKFQYSCQQIFT